MPVQVMAVLGVVGGPVGGLLADRLGRKPAALGGTAIVAAAFGTLPFVESQAATAPTPAPATAPTTSPSHQPQPQPQPQPQSWPWP